MKKEEGLYIRRKKPKVYITRENNGLIRCNQITALQLRIYCVLDTYSNCEEIYLTQNIIAKKTGNISRQWVNKSIGELVSIGLLEVDQCFDSNGGQVSNSYYLVDFEDWADKNKIEYDRYWIALVNDFTFTDKLTATEWRFYNVLKTMGGYDHITPSIKELMSYTGFARQTIVKIKQSAEEKGIISTERRGNAFDGNLPTEYFLTDEVKWLKQHPSEDN